MLSVVIYDGVLSQNGSLDVERRKEGGLQSSREKPEIVELLGVFVHASVYPVSDSNVNLMIDIVAFPTIVFALYVLRFEWMSFETQLRY